MSSASRFVPMTREQRDALATRSFPAAREVVAAYDAAPSDPADAIQRAVVCYTPTLAKLVTEDALEALAPGHRAMFLAGLPDAAANMDDFEASDWGRS